MADDRDKHEGGSAAGGEAPDLDALAKRYLDLWEDQLRQLSSDPEVARAMARTVELMNAGATAFTGMMQAGMQASAAGPQAGQPGAGQSGEAGDEQSADGPERGAGPSGSDQGDAAGAAGAGAGTAAAGDASGGADVGVDDLARRVAVLEQRIADLEAALDGKGAGPRSRSRRRRS